MKRAAFGLLTGVLISLACAGPARAEASLPEIVRGFSGQVRGVVHQKGERNTFRFTVLRVLKVWKNNKARSPKSLAGRTVQVGPRWMKGENGKWQPVERHVAFIRKLKIGQEITLEIVNSERSHFDVLELSEEQRHLADGQGKQEESGSDRSSSTELRELREEVKRLREEIAEMRRLLEKRERLAREREE